MTAKLLVFDLDGTLLRDDKTISAYTLSTLQKCRDNGIKLAYATGRGNSAQQLLPTALFDGAARMNGAVGYAGEQLIYSRLIPTKSVRELLVAADFAGMEVAAEVNGRHYTNFDMRKRWPWIESYEIVDFHSLDVEVEKLSIPAEDPGTVAFIKRYLTPELYVCVSRDDLAMVMSKEATKSKAVAALAGY